jgi:HAD superfamily hydrolase (TIGR01509 family)
VHDFDEIRRRLDVPVGMPILEAVRDMEAGRAARTLERLEAIEYELTEKAVAAPGALRLLATLRRGGASLGILTRNTRRVAWATLCRAGLDSFFAAGHVLGRDEAPPKPRPEGVHRLLEAWHASPEHAVVVGDYLFDLQAGRAAGALTVQVDPRGDFTFADVADLCVRSLEELLP